MKAQLYIVIGTYSHEQNSWIPDGDIRHYVSGHRTSRAASIAADEAHEDLGGCDGSNMLAEVMKRFARLGSKDATKYTDAEYGSDEDAANTYEHAGWLYLEESIWDRSTIVVTQGGLGYQYT